MEKTNRVKVDKMPDSKTTWDPVSEGEYVVKVETVDFEDDLAKVKFQILDDCECAGWHLYHTFRPYEEYFVNEFENFMKAIHLEIEDGVYPIDQAVGKTLSVVVKHRTRDGKTYANVGECKSIPNGSLIE